MIERDLTEAERTAFGVTLDQQREVSEWCLAHTGQLLGAAGRGGSGVFVETSVGTALLTARHVVLPALLSGEMAVVHVVDGVGRSLPALGVRVATKCDAALVYVGEVPGMARLRRDDWEANRAEPTLARGAPIVAVGTPGALKSEPDLERRVIEHSRTLVFWTAITDPRDPDGLIVADIDERQQVPRSFAGMSGGPAFNLARQLLGIITSEGRSSSDGILLVSPRASWCDLHDPFVPPLDAPSDGRSQRAVVRFLVRHMKANRKDPPIEVRLDAEFFWSPRQPEHVVGAIGRITTLSVRRTTGAAWHRISLESTFPLPNDHTESDRLHAARIEALFLMEAMGYVPA